MSPSPPADTKPLKAASTTTLADLIGDAPGVIDGCLLPLASIYELLDLACGRCAHGYIGGSCVTVSLDHGEVLAPLCRGDFLRVSARVVAVGSSSLTLRVGAEKERAPVAGGGRPAFLRCFEAQMTFVAIDEKGRPAKGLLSGLQVDGEGGEVGREQEEVRQGKKEVRERVKRAERQNFGFLEKATDDFEEIRESRMSIDDSRVEFRKQYLPRHENFGGIVFGGDILVLLERAAIHCGKRFTRSAVTCVFLHGIHFREPVQPTYLMCTAARVVLVRRYFIDVEVTVTVERLDGSSGISNVGYFTLVAHDKTGRAAPVSTGIDFEESSEDSLLAHAKIKALLDGRKYASLRDDSDYAESLLEQRL